MMDGLRNIQGLRLREERNRDFSDCGDLSASGGMRERVHRMARGQDKGRTVVWECSTCTFHNKQSRSVCEMCTKSRDLPPLFAVTRPSLPPPRGLACAQCTP